MIIIKFGNHEIQPGIISFPDGTFKIDIESWDFGAPTEIIWKYENENEFIQLFYIAEHFHSHGFFDFGLNMPYLPNARMDRVKADSEVFTLKYFCKMINTLGFSYVRAIDVHSSVGEALIDHICVETPEKYIRQTIEMSGIDKAADYIFFPDEGSCKRYSSMFGEFLNIGFGIKKRDWKTGRIQGLDIHGDSPKGKNVLIIDDICSYGGTVYHSALKLKELGCGDVFAYFSHCENSIAKGELLKGDLIKGIFTTNSLCTLSPDEFPKLHIIDCLKEEN